ncbi:PHA/PHB synthase family protein [Azorhizobium doebereinerae]|uniref:PHA/PHB synthase family protein n=1 Tax=Azorhizobium doebereinerae TaxID=281091 RepID=UPI00040AA59D|nr:alpha/beta fold hydrolase [Azorhizobium doebereinerae]
MNAPLAPSAPASLPATIPPASSKPAAPAAHRAPVSVAAAPVEDVSLGLEGFRAYDRMVQAFVARFTGGLSPAALELAWTDWGIHMASAPGKRAELILKAWRKAARLAGYAARASLDANAPPVIAPLPGDERFSSPAWQKWPYSLYAQNFLLTQQWWHNVTHEVPGTSRHTQDVTSFLVRQMLDMASPSNLPLTNPDVLAAAHAEGGANFMRGWQNWMDDTVAAMSGAPAKGTENFRPGVEVAVTPGQVVFRNHLMELIQYAPATPDVYAEPVLLVPAWIMKYYILDLSPHNSLVKDLVSRGHTVFCVSWRNVTAEDRNLSFDDYRRQGVLAALDAINAIMPGARVHGTGYCLGGTLLAITAAAMARAGDERLASLSLFAAQTDFTEPGELQLFIDDSQLFFLESMMWDQGYLSAEQMAGAFQMLRSNDLVWSRMIQEYLLGARSPMIDLMAWNADTTRMPYRMHSEYLRDLFLDNAFASGHYVVDGHPAALPNVRQPIFAVGTERDHVAPWHSVYKLHYLSDTDVTFVLTSGGHNAGIVSEPGHPHRHFRLRHKAAADAYISPDEWVAATQPQQGSWWPEWSAWLAARSSPMRVAPPPMGNGPAGYPPLGPAPGTYVMQR